MGCIKNPVPSDTEYLFTTTNLEYDSVASELSLYVEIENVTLSNIIDSVWSELYNSENKLVHSSPLMPTYDIDNDSPVSQNLYSTTYIISELPYDVYIVKFTMKDESGKLFSEFSKLKDLNPIMTSQKSEIIDYKICTTYDYTCLNDYSCKYACSEISNNEVVLDDHEWVKTTFLLHVSDSNGTSDISHLKYEIKGELAGCNEDTNNDGTIDSGDYWGDYVDLGGDTDETEWELDFLNYYSNNGKYESSFIFAGLMLLRPRDGSAYYDNEEEIFPAKDCGRIGTVLLRFIVTDSSEEPTDITDIPLIILAP